MWQLANPVTVLWHFALFASWWPIFQCFLHSKIGKMKNGQTWLVNGKWTVKLLSSRAEYLYLIKTLNLTLERDFTHMSIEDVTKATPQKPQDFSASTSSTGSIATLFGSHDCFLQRFGCRMCGKWWEKKSCARSDASPWKVRQGFNDLLLLGHVFSALSSWLKDNMLVPFRWPSVVGHL